MNHLTLSLLAFTGGVFLAVQGGLNAQLGVLLKNPLLASLVAFFCSATFAFCFVLLSVKHLPDVQEIKSVPYYLWFSGGLFSVLGISLYYYTIPRLGVSSMISLGLCGQVIFSVIAGHFAWFGLPQEPLGIKRLIGILILISGIIIINKN
ncbi:DMT family transporter [Porifericola rhodea]|uniref:DMT family transporter n=1 Tax=Porifericola rhodea TaxID=930972 RepID=UPI002666E179|nr:DMT family transporter [Porifericola rhodea]WKN31224.1 DMT family transporter [Porifericola rhodea]